jgi:hypothetical protein
MAYLEAQAGQSFNKSTFASFCHTHDSDDDVLGAASCEVRDESFDISRTASHPTSLPYQIFSFEAACCTISSGFS